MSIQPAAGPRAAGPLLKASVRFARTAANSTGRAILFFGEAEIPLTDFDSKDEAIAEAPAGNWRLTVDEGTGARGEWRGTVVPGRTEPIVIRQVPASTVEVRARTADGRKLDQPHVWIADEPWLRERGRTAQGGALISVPSLPSRSTICVAIDGFEIASVPVSLSALSKAPIVDVVLAPRAGHTVTGMLTSALDGSPLNGAVVLAIPVSREADVRQALAGMAPDFSRVAHDRSGEDGQFRLRPLGESGSFSLIVLGEGIPASIVTQFSTADRDSELGVFAVAAGREVAGSVRDSGGKALAHAYVHVAIEGQRGGWAGQQGSSGSAETDLEGRFNLHGLPSGVRIRLLADAKGFRVASRGLDREPARSDREIEIVLERGATLRGSVRSAKDGEPIAPASLVAAPAITPVGSPQQRGDGDAGIPTRLLATSDETGSYTLDGLSCSGIAITIQANGYVSQRIENPVLDCENGPTRLDIVLEPALLWTGRVLQRGSGAGVAGATVRLT
ncbi:MAG: carboxypeptidase-like regulatory domain-containing protein, partial [Acidobacteriota bacterium]